MKAPEVLIQVAKDRYSRHVREAGACEEDIQRTRAYLEGERKRLDEHQRAANELAAWLRENGAEVPTS